MIQLALKSSGLDVAASAAPVVVRTPGADRLGDTAHERLLSRLRHELAQEKPDAVMLFNDA